MYIYVVFCENLSFALYLVKNLRMEASNSGTRWYQLTFPFSSPFAFLACAFSVRNRKKKKKNHCQDQCQEAFPCFLLGVFWFHLTLKSLIHSELIFIYSVRKESSRASLPSCLHLSQASYLNKSISCL